MIRYIIEAGIQAPSGDNNQPWKFSHTHDTISLYLDRDSDHSFFNVRQIASIISCGAVIENMHLAANALGLDARIDYLPAGENSNHMATVSLLRPDHPGPRDPLAGMLWERHTNRTFYGKKPVPESVIEALQTTIAPFPGARLHLITDKAKRIQMAKLVYKVDRIRTEHRPLHEHLCKMIRFTEAEALEKKDGLPLKNLEAGAAGELFLKTTRPWPIMNLANILGLGRMVAMHAMAGILNSSGVALLTVDGMKPRDFLTGGQALERLWLTLAQEELSMQPMTAITLFWLRWVLLSGKSGFSNSHQKLLNQVWINYRGLFPSVDFEQYGQVMLFRFGYGKPVRYGTHRIHMNQMIK